jgi:hypothetical protein
MPDRRAADLLEVNRRFYDPPWADSRLVEAERFNTWPLVILTPRVSSRP